ncbi:hypothetical protein BD779DRAFT_1788819 [Infundibulicybe gibba]|nr:hypothetical protein BD779DRAFT_1788819 [Infundibulicybe gibba]
MFSKALSLCALVLSGVGCAAAQGISPGRYTMHTSVQNNQNVELRGPGKNLIAPGGAPTLMVPSSDQWDLAPGQSGGFTMQNVAFGSFLKVDSNDPGTPVTSGTQDQATSFAVTSAGSGQFHVNVVAQDLLWALGPITRPIPVPDSPVVVQPANGGQGQLWQFTRI